MVLDFKEIPQANTASGEQDTFELFARDFISEILGFRIISQPNRGADGGKDILAEETQAGMLSDTKITWLISCKHFAHSGQAVSESHEQNILDRIMQHHADGFIGFYSTIASSGLGNRLDSIKGRYKTYVFDKMLIEQKILDAKNTSIFERYFPSSFNQWKLRNNQPTLLLAEYQPLRCAVCGKDLLKDKSNGIILFERKFDSRQIENVIPVCRGNCDHAYEAFLREKGYLCGWDSIEDLTLPTIYLKRQLAILNNLFYSNPAEQFSNDGIEAYKTVLIALSQLALRECTEEERERAFMLTSLEY